MYLIVGLGNPGQKYVKNRHNVGHMLIDYLAIDTHLKRFKDIVLKKTGVFMNESGTQIKKWTSSTKGRSPSGRDLFIAHDDLDIPLGKIKIQKGRGPKVHNGITSIENELRTDDFMRIRIGVENRKPENRTKGEDYVLEDFTEEELKLLQNAFAEVSRQLTLYHFK